MASSQLKSRRPTGHMPSKYGWPTDSPCSPCRTQVGVRIGLVFSVLAGTRIGNQSERKGTCLSIHVPNGRGHLARGQHGVASLVAAHAQAPQGELALGLH